VEVSTHRHAPKPVVTPQVARSRSNKQKIYAILKEEIELPAMPAVAAKVVELVENDRTNAEDLAKIISWDPVMSLRLLRIANSVVYRRRIPTTNVKDAIVRIGINRTRDIVYGLSAQSIAKSSRKIDKNIWKKAVAVSIAAQTIGKPRGIVHEAFICGLLHNIGKMILCYVDEEGYQESLKLAKSNRLMDRAAEQEVFGFNHNSVGGALLTEWGMRKSIVESVRWYNQIGIAPDLTPSAQTYSALIAMACKLVDAAGIAGSSTRNHDFVRDPVAAQLKIGPQEIPGLIEKIKATYQEESALFL